MIRINLLAGDRDRPKRGVEVDLAQKVTIGCSVILVATVVLIGWRFWSLRQDSAQVTQELAAADQELQRLAPVLERVLAFEAQGVRLTERIALIEQLRDVQGGPVRMLDASQLPAFEASVAELDARLESLWAVLPEEKDAGALLRRLQTIATQSNLSIRAFTPQAAVVQALHSDWPSRLELSGTYHNLGIFFDRVSRFSQIINISDVEIRAIDPPGLNTTISAACTATTYVLNETPIEESAEPVT